MKKIIKRGKGQPPKGANGRRTNIRLYDEDRENLKKITKKTGENTSDIIRRLIKQEIEK